MKYYRHTLLLTLVIYSVFGAQSQITPAKHGSPDRYIHQLSAYLSLSSSQEQAFLFLERQQQQSLDSIDAAIIDPDRRKLALSACLKQHDKTLKAILTDEQWKKYDEMLEARRQAFLKNAANKKINVQEIPKDKP